MRASRQEAAGRRPLKPARAGDSVRRSCTHRQHRAQLEKALLRSSPATSRSQRTITVSKARAGAGEKRGASNTEAIIQCLDDKPRRPCGETPTRRPMSGRLHIGTAGARAYFPGHGHPDRHRTASRPRAHDPRRLPRLPVGAAAHPGLARHGRPISRMRILPAGTFGSAPTLRGLSLAATAPRAGARGMCGYNAATAALRRLDGSAMAGGAEHTAVAS
jgi:hypothetical protein